MGNHHFKKVSELPPTYFYCLKEVFGGFGRKEGFYLFEVAGQQISPPRLRGTY